MKLKSVTAALLAGMLSTGVAAAEAMMVYKSKTCGCCEVWLEHMKDAGFEVTSKNLDNMSSIKAQLGVTPRSASCHTAVVNGYIVEGHVPAEDVLRMLAEKPDIRGIAAPGMPLGSPGMEVEPGLEQTYNVMAIHHDNSLTIYNTHNEK